MNFNIERILLGSKASSQHGQLCIPDGKALGRCSELPPLLLSRQIESHFLEVRSESDLLPTCLAFGRLQGSQQKSSIP